MDSSLGKPPWLEGASWQPGTEVRCCGNEQGWGLHATRAFRKGEEMWREWPIVFAQQHTSKAVLPACLACGAFAGSFRDMLTFVLKRANKSLAQFPDLTASGLLESPEFQRPAAVPCPHGCGEVFCSEACRDAQLERGHHRVICAELPADRRKRWVKFCEHARLQHESFILAAYAVAQIICDVRAGRQDLHDAIGQLLQNCLRPWHELVPEGVLDRDARVQSRVRRVERSSELLCAALGPEPGMDVLFQVDFFSRLVGMLDRTCFCLGREHPLDKPLLRVMPELSPDVRGDLWMVTGSWIAAKSAVEEEGDEVSGTSASEEESEEEANEGKTVVDEDLPAMPRFEGLGLFPCIRVMNHSCFPNVEFKDFGDSCESIAVARRDILAGEQLVMSYLDPCSSRSIALRQRALRRDYGFSCLCLRCRAEACDATLRGSELPGAAAPLKWLEHYAKDNGLGVHRVAYDVLMSLPPELRGPRFSTKDTL